MCDHFTGRCSFFEMSAWKTPISLVPQILVRSKLWLCQRRPFPTKVRRLYSGLDGDGDEGMMRMLQHRPQKRMVVQKQWSRAGRKGKQIICVISSALHRPPVQHQTLGPWSPLRTLGVSRQHPPNLRLVDAMKTQLA